MIRVQLTIMFRTLRKVAGKLLCSLLIALFSFGCGSLKVKNYYIPYDFEGHVAIIFKSKSEVKPKGDTQNIDIPSTGIFYSNQSFEEGYYVTNYYQHRRNGGFDTLFVLDQSGSYDTSKSFIGFPRALTFSTSNSSAVDVISFYVSKDRQFFNSRTDFERRLEKMMFIK